MKIRRLAVVCAKCSTQHFLEAVGPDVELVSMTILCRGCGEELVVSGGASLQPVAGLPGPSGPSGLCGPAPTIPEPEWYRRLGLG